MFINPQNINNIAIWSTEKAVDFRQFKKFIKKSPYIQRVAFVGAAIFGMPEFSEMVRFCAENNIWLIFGEMGKTTQENLRALVEYGNVISVNMYEDEEDIKIIQEYKQQFNSEYPQINLIVQQKHTPQDEISPRSYAFYNLADDVQNVPCLNLLEEPMLNYNGDLLGCWANPDIKHPVNAFDLGMEKAINSTAIKKILTMLKTGKICKSCPCTRCTVFKSLVWSDKKIDIFKTLF